LPITIVLLLFEFGYFNKFNSIFYLTICFFELSFVYAIIYQVIVSRLSFFHPDNESEALTESFYKWTILTIFLGILLLILHIRARRKRLINNTE